MQLITRKDSLIRIKTPYKNEEFVKEIKAIGGTWKTEEKYWEISFDHEEEARELVEKHFCRKDAVTLRERVDRAVQNKDALFSGNDDLLLGHIYGHALRLSGGEGGGRRGAHRRA